MAAALTVAENGGRPEWAHGPAFRCLPRCGRLVRRVALEAPTAARPTSVRPHRSLRLIERRAAVETFRSPPPCGVRCRLLRGGGGYRSRGCGRAADCGRCGCDARGMLSACHPKQLTSLAGRPFGASVSMFVLLWLAACFSTVREALYPRSVCTKRAAGTENRVCTAHTRP